MSSQSKVSANAKDIVKHWTGKTLSITDVGSKFKSKEHVKSTRFFSRDDPSLVTFMFDVHFGDKVDGFVSVYVGPTNRSVAMTMIKFILYDVNDTV